MIRPLSLAMLLFLAIPAYCQVLPKEGSKLNYRLVVFSFPGFTEKGDFSIEVAEGRIYSADSFSHLPVQTIRCHSGKEMAELPAFGSDYTWRYKERRSGGSAIAGDLHHFTVLTSPAVDTSHCRLRLFIKGGSYPEATVFVDAFGVLFDMNGRPLWFLPDTSSKNAPAHMFRDLKASPGNTITFLDGDKIYESDLGGKILWKGPRAGQVSGDTSEHFHHQLNKLGNGHYMVLGTETVLRKLPGYQSDTAGFDVDPDLVWGKDRNFYQKIQFGTLIEYDSTGKVTWSLKTSRFAGDIGEYSDQEPGGKFVLKDAHINSFYFDTKRREIYLSLRDVNSIFKVSYPSGKLLATYQGHPKGSDADRSLELFFGQHSVSELENGDICLFNNGHLFDASDSPSVEILSQIGENDLRRKWVYRFTSPEETDVYHQSKLKEEEMLRKAGNGTGATNVKRSSGGNVISLTGGDLFVSSGGQAGTLFIISPEKKLRWEAVPETYNARTRKWEPSATYRASIIPDRGRLQEMILKAEERP